MIGSSDRSSAGRGRPGTALAGAFILIALAWAETAAAGPGDVARGREVAETHCSRCHVVGDFNRMGGIGSTPSFQLLVNALKDFEERFATFYARRPHGAFITVKGVPRLTDLPDNAAPIELMPEQVDDLVAFIKTLKNN